MPGPWAASPGRGAGFVSFSAGDGSASFSPLPGPKPKLLASAGFAPDSDPFGKQTGDALPGQRDDLQLRHGGLGVVFLVELGGELDGQLGAKELDRGCAAIVQLRARRHCHQHRLTLIAFGLHLQGAVGDRPDRAFEVPVPGPASSIPLAVSRRRQHRHQRHEQKTATRHESPPSSFSYCNGDGHFGPGGIDRRHAPSGQARSRRRHFQATPNLFWGACAHRADTPPRNEPRPGGQVPRGAAGRHRAASRRGDAAAIDIKGGRGKGEASRGWLFGS